MFFHAALPHKVAYLELSWTVEAEEKETIFAVFCGGRLPTQGGEASGPEVEWSETTHSTLIKSSHRRIRL